MSILLFIVLVLPALLYLAAWRVSSAPGPAGERRGGVILLSLGLLAHAVALYHEVLGSGWRFGFAPILSATLWIGLVILWFEGLQVRLQPLRRLVLPVAAVAAVLPLLFPGADISAQASLPLFVPHLLVGTLAYGVLALAALHAILMIATERALHGGAAPLPDSAIGRFLEELPPLLVLERILFRFITVGFALLTLTALSGVLFSEEVFGRPFVADHKSVFSLIAWAVFGVLLIGRRLRGWRGRTALRLTLAGFGLLLLAYVGSRFVLEVVLGRS
ncbi:MAG: cytochrome c biogenesis protein CcsA [Burkholderiaceae bacterium]